MRGFDQGLNEDYAWPYICEKPACFSGFLKGFRRRETAGLGLVKGLL